jgi:drug/metabolite transporter (DMT)-like permease
MAGTSSPIARGVLLALAAAAAFGATTPVVQRLASGAGPAATAALLYAGAAGFAAVQRRSEARLTRAWWPRVVGVGLTGAFLAPIALAAGLARTSGLTASLLLNLEAVFTVVLGAAFWREPVGGRIAAAVALIAGGGALVALDQGGGGASEWAGPALIAAATLAWAADNTLSRPLSDLDPADVVAAKGVVGVVASLAVVAATGAAWPSAGAAAGIVACGAVGFGASLRLYLRAQRVLGSARTGSVFAVAPFLGAIGAMALGAPWGGWWTVAGGLAMMAGVWLHLGEDHDHDHVHEALEHDHPHRHDDGHHDDHTHDPPVFGEHAHPHRHAARAHRHAHGEDLHHRHHG